MDVKLISLRGRHFKVYDPDSQLVLEHPSVSEEVDVCFYASVLGSNPYLKICVTSFIETKMRMRGQRPRADLYILAEHGKRISKSIEKPIGNIIFDDDKQQVDDISFGHPVARFGRQSVPDVSCLCQYIFYQMEAPFSNGLLRYLNGKGALDLEKPGCDQTKWKKEGGSTQLHFSFFHPEEIERQTPAQDTTFYVYVPWKHAKKIGECLNNIDK